MHFKHPEVLFALFLLLIPLLVHLFQLRKFQKEEFTNVKFLKRIAQQTRQSSRLKKWLILMTRMLALACLVLAFAQPFLPAAREDQSDSDKFIYLDNSFSLQAPGEAGNLLQSAVQDLIRNLPEEGNFHLITNDTEHQDLSPEALKSRLQEIEFTAQHLDLKELELKISRISPGDSTREILMISDFQENLAPPVNQNTQVFDYYLIPQVPREYQNLVLDTIYLSEDSPEGIQLTFLLKSDEESKLAVPVAIFNGTELLARKTVRFDGDREREGSFRLTTREIPDGHITIEDQGLEYDNQLFFSLGLQEPLKGIVLSAAGTDSNFFKRIFQEPEFDLQLYHPNDADYNQLSQAAFVVLNQIEDPPAPLKNALKTIHNDGGSLIIIPPDKDPGLNAWLKELSAPVFGTPVDQQRLITRIAFDHPLLSQVFEEKVENFDYPLVRQFFRLEGPGSQILGFQDGGDFLKENNRVFLFSAPLSREFSNFKNAPLIVPVLYTMARSSRSPSQLYYQVGREQQVNIPVDQQGDQVLSLSGNSEEFIPLQQAFPGQVKITTGMLPATSGNYHIHFNEERLGTLSFNYTRRESFSGHMDPQHMDHEAVFPNISSYFRSARDATENQALWKSFVIFALILLTLEMLLLKYFK